MPRDPCLHGNQPLDPQGNRLSNTCNNTNTEGLGLSNLEPSCLSLCSEGHDLTNSLLGSLLHMLNQFSEQVKAARVLRLHRPINVNQSLD